MHAHVYVPQCLYSYVIVLLQTLWTTATHVVSRLCAAAALSSMLQLMVSPVPHSVLQYSRVS